MFLKESLKFYQRHPPSPCMDGIVRSQLKYAAKPPPAVKGSPTYAISTNAVPSYVIFRHSTIKWWNLR